MSLTLESPAKINLFLQVPGKREDGFHEVRTLMLPVSLVDTLTFEPLENSRIEIESSDPLLPTDGSNLIRRAAWLLQSQHAPMRGACIRLQKNIPIGAGLGGGSSNGSITLVGLNRLWNLGLSEDDLEKLAAKLGSDTAFFVRNRPALSEGRGEILTPVEFPIFLPVFLMNFGFGSSTVWAYRNLKLEIGNEKLKIKDETQTKAFQHFESLLKSSPSISNFGFFTSHSKSFFQNDLEAPVFRKFPVLKIAKDFLMSQPQVAGAMMCGSGSTIMALLRSRNQGEELHQTVLKRFGSSVWTWMGQTRMTRS